MNFDRGQGARPSMETWFERPRFDVIRSRGERENWCAGYTRHRLAFGEHELMIMNDTTQYLTLQSKIDLLRL